MKEYDYLIVGAGIFGAVCARELTDKGAKCLVIDRRGHIAGNAIIISIRTMVLFRIWFIRKNGRLFVRTGAPAGPLRRLY